MEVCYGRALKAGDTAYIVENNRIVRECTIVRKSGNLYIIRFNSGGGIQVKGHRLFALQEEAEDSVSQLKQKRKQQIGYRSPYDYWH